MNIGIIGLGLIGGSKALAAKKAYNQCKIWGDDRNPNHLKEAKQLGLIDEVLDVESYKVLDLLILAIPVDHAVDVIESILDRVSPNTLVIDTGSTKRLICQQVADHPHRKQFLAAHPIAGTEYSGPSAALEDLFVNQTQIFCQKEKTDSSLLQIGIDFVQKLQMKILTMSAEEHDKHIAYVSHLSHISSFMLGKTVMDKEEKSDNVIYQMAGSGFASTVRLAKSNPTTWTSIFRHNQQNILEVLNQYIEKLDEFKVLLESKDFDSIHQQLIKSNEINPILKGINQNNN